MRRAVALAGLIGAAACSVRAPAPIDVLALTRAEGSEGARRTLVARVLADPTDIAARLGLAALADRLGRPGEAIAQLEAVVAINGPAGPRWHADDRARLARLLHARARVRVARGAASGEADLRRGLALGEAVDPYELARARAATAIAQLRHADAEVRAEGKRVLAELAPDDARWGGALPQATPAERAAFGAYLWAAGARRAAYDELAAWHDALATREREARGAGGRIQPAPPPRDPAAQAAYLRALAWWSPLWLGDVPPPPADELVGPEACRFPAAACRARDAIGTDAEVELAGSPIAAAARTDAASAPAAARPPVDDPEDALAWLAIGLRATLRGEASWGATVRARIDVSAVAGAAALPAGARAVLARLAGTAQAAPAAAPTLSLPPLLAGAARILADATADDVRLALGTEAATPDGAALLAIVEPPAAPALDPAVDLRAAALARYVRSRVPDAPPDATLVAIARAFRRDPSSAERLARDAVASAPDAAAASAAMGAAFEALADPARARAAWQAAVDASREPAYQAGLAIAAAKANDPDAALVFATSAAASSGDPAIVWIAVARALIGGGALPQALTAARDAIDLAGPDALPAALDLAIAASGALGRAAQVGELAGKRARLAPAVATAGAPDDPTDADAARAALGPAPTASALARLWVATRWNPRDAAGRAVLARALPAGDPRARTIQLELVALAGDPDPARALVAVQALP